MVNKRLVRKPFPIPKISTVLSTVLQELEGFTFATTLDLNMGYYTIWLYPETFKICTIIFNSGNYSYFRLPMGIAGSPDVFQAKNVSANGGPQFYEQTWMMFYASQGQAWMTTDKTKGSPYQVARSGFESQCPEIQILYQRRIFGPCVNRTWD